MGQSAHDRAEVPDSRERVWVVVISNYELRTDPQDEDANVLALQPLYVLSPKGGGPASAYDSGTWHDRSMASQRLGMVADRLRKDRRANLHQQALRLAFVADERFHWSDGEPLGRERVERAA
jgi:hypothetical protein